MTAVDARRALGHGLTKAAEALAAGSDELHLRDAVLHLASAVGAESVAILALTDEGELPQVIADSDEHRSQVALVALVTADVVRDAIATGDVTAAPAPRTPAGDVHPLAWAAFPLLVGRRVRGVLVAAVASSASSVDDLPVATVLCGRAAAALVAIVLPDAQVLQPPPAVPTRTRKITLTDVQRERRMRAIERYRAFIDSASDGIVVLDALGVVLYMNRAAEQVTGYAREGLAGKPLGQIAVEEYRPMLSRQIARATQSLNVDNFDLALVTSSGDRMTMSVASIGILSDHGAAIFAFRDVTLARELEIELRRTTEFLERILNSAVDGIIAADMKGTVLLYNHSAERICGYPAADVIGRMSVKGLYPPRMAQEIMRLLRSSARGGGGRLEPVRRELKDSSGQLIPVSISAALVLDDAGREIATVGIFTDLRERIRMEERLASAQEKLAISEKQVVAIELAGAAAHELNQPLTSIMGYAEMLVRKLEAGSPHLRAVETILTESERMAGIVRQLGSLTRYETKSYVGGAQIIDLDRSSEATPHNK